MSTLTHPLQHISGKDHDISGKDLRRPQKIMKALSALEAEQSTISPLAGQEEDLAKLVERLDKASTAYGMEISAERPS